MKRAIKSALLTILWLITAAFFGVVIVGGYLVFVEQYQADLSTAYSEGFRDGSEHFRMCAKWAGILPEANDD